MLAKILKLYETDATCYVLITKLILMTKKLWHELNYGLEVICNSEKKWVGFS